ncbi:MAG: hypothetical protein R2695_15270 [Acidimicrobiales bacterium]
MLVGIGIGVVVWRVQPQFASTRTEALRIGAGILVVGAGIAALLAGSISLRALRNGLVAGVLVLGGVALIVGPWIAVLMRERTEERCRRLHADARADMAAHLHDSVLQTLALIQRTDDPKTVAQLGPSTGARAATLALRRFRRPGRDDAQERDRQGGGRRRGSLRRRGGDGGRRRRGPRLCAGGPDRAAVREAATNAAKWSGCPQVSIYAEVEPDGVRAFVRDTGAGFDPASVAADRLGVRESIVGRLERRRGIGRDPPAPGEGTEVEPVPSPGRRRSPDTV